MPRRVHSARRAFAAALALLLASAGASGRPEGSQAAGSDPDERLARGSVSFCIHCRNCHGDSGEGDGPMAELLKVAPADLTRLARDNGGEYPAARVYRTIDGREEVRGHGPREMPIWGIGFQDLGRDSDQETEVRAKILDLVAYIESIQAADGD